MVKYKSLIHVINDYCTKTHLTNAEKKAYIKKLTDDQKKMLIHMAMGFEDVSVRAWTINDYENLLGTGSDEELWEYEKAIFDNITKGRIDNLLENCSDFNFKDYVEDTDYGYPSIEKGQMKRGELETKQADIQDNEGYPEGLFSSVKVYWVGGQFDKIQKAYLDGKMDHVEDIGDTMGIETPAFVMKDYIDNYSPGLESDSILWRGGHWDVGAKVGDILTAPVFNSTSYSKTSAISLGMRSSKGDSPYLIKVYAPEGTKGLCVNSPNLAWEYPEHEYLLGPNQKYIVLDVDDENRTASIKLINEE